MVGILLGAALVVLGGLGVLIYVGTRSGRSDLVAPPAEFGPEANQRPELPRIEPEKVELPPEKERPELAAPPPEPTPQEPAASPFEELSREHSSDAADGPAPERVAKEGTRSQIDTPPSDAETLWKDTPKPAGTPPGKTESDYSQDELVERDVRALLLQNQRDRAIRYVRSELRMKTPEATAYVDAIAARTAGL